MEELEYEGLLLRTTAAWLLLDRIYSAVRSSVLSNTEMHLHSYRTEISL